MPRQFAAEQVKHIAEAFKSLADAQLPSDLSQVTQALRSSPQSAYAKEELDAMEATFAKLAAPLSSRAQPWQVTKDRGFFFVFEGLDRSGKSTQSKMLREYLGQQNGESKVKWLCFPQRDTAIGSLIDLYLQRKIELGDRTVHLLFSANRWELSEMIVGDLNSGVSIVCDRYAFSGVAYTAAKGLDFEWCQAPDKGIPCPDGIFFMHVEPEVGNSRAAFGDERYEQVEFQSRVREEFKQDRLYRGVSWHLVDGSREIETIHEEIKGKVEAIIAKSQGDERPLPGLWLDEE